MRRVKKIKRLFWLAIAFIAIASGTFLLMPLVTEATQNRRMLTMAIGIAFWLSSIAGYALLIVANIERKWFISHRADGNLKMNCLPGVISFFQNIPGTVFDVIMLMSLVMLLIIAFTKWRYDYISYILLSLFYLSLNLHSMFNGRIYKSTKFRRTRRDCSYD